jgi:hypothetical protein
MLNDVLHLVWSSELVRLHSMYFPRFNLTLENIFNNRGTALICFSLWARSVAEVIQRLVSLLDSNYCVIFNCLFVHFKEIYKITGSQFGSSEMKYCSVSIWSLIKRIMYVRNASSLELLTYPLKSKASFRFAGDKWLLKEESWFTFVLDVVGKTVDRIEGCVMDTDAVSNLSYGRIINNFSRWLSVIRTKVKKVWLKFLSGTKDV